MLRVARDLRVDIFEWLQGEWAFVRRVPGYAKVRGAARITATGEGLARYEETAVVSLAAGGRLNATQCYLFSRLAPPANGMEVRFCDSGDLFERLDFREHSPGGLEARARYLCAEDVYESIFAVDAEGRLHVEHEVRGPKKDYRVETHYRRMRERWGANKI